MKQYTPITPKPIAGTTNDKPADLLIVRPANQWMQEAAQRPIPRMLFSEFWHQGELSILFADTNLGKKHTGRANSRFHQSRSTDRGL